jgi:hypothetical protein
LLIFTIGLESCASSAALHEQREAKEQPPYVQKIYKGDGFNLYYPIYWEESKNGPGVYFTNATNSVELLIDRSFDSLVANKRMSAGSKEAMESAASDAFAYYEIWAQSQGHGPPQDKFPFEEMADGVYIASIDFSVDSSTKRVSCYIVAFNDGNSLMGFIVTEPKKVDYIESKVETLSILTLIKPSD